MKNHIALFALLAVSSCLCLYSCGVSSTASNSGAEASRTMIYNVKGIQEELVKTIEECEELIEADYSPYTWLLLVNELENAKSVIEHDGDDGKKLSKANAGLMRARRNLAPSISSGKYSVLDYESCVRNPESWEDQYVGYAGIVNEADTDGDYRVLTVAKDGSNETLTQVSYPIEIAEENIIVGDVVRVFGSVYDVVDGKTQGGKPITYPVISATYIERQK